MKANFHRSRDSKRVFLTAKGKDKELDKFLAGILKHQLRPRIHPSIYNLNGGGQHSLVVKIQRLRSDLGLWMAVCDLKEFFLSIDWFRCGKLLRRAGVPRDFHPYFGLARLQANWPISHRGLPQGFSCSPWIAGIYLTPILKTLSRRYWVFVFVDDLVLLAKCRRSANSAIALLRKRIQHHSFPERLLSIHEDGSKAPRIFSPAESVDLLGFTLCGVRE